MLYDILYIFYPTKCRVVKVPLYEYISTVEIWLPLVLICHVKVYNACELHYLQQCCMGETEEREMQVDVDNRSVLILPWWKNHLEGTKAEALTHRKTYIYIKIYLKWSQRDKYTQISDIRQTEVAWQGGESVFWPHVAVQVVVKGPGTAWLKTPLLSPQSQLASQAAAGPGDWEGGAGRARYRGKV